MTAPSARSCVANSACLCGSAIAGLTIGVVGIALIIIGIVAAISPFALASFSIYHLVETGQYGWIVGVILCELPIAIGIMGVIAAGCGRAGGYLLHFTGRWFRGLCR